MATKKAPAKTQGKSTDIAADDVPFDFSADMGGGMEGTDKESFAIPFLTVLQKISPQVDEADAKFVEGAKGGQLMNTVTSALYDGKEGLLFLPCAYQRRFLRWAPRGSEQGFRGEYLPEDVAAMRESGEIVESEGKLYAPDSDGKVNDKKCDRFADTRNHFGICYNPETGEASQVLLSLSSTQIKKSKQLMSMLSQVKVKGPNGMATPPTWANQIRVTTVLESNDQGSWYGVRFAPEGFVPSQELYEMGKKFNEMILAGEAKVNYKDADTGAENNETAFDE